MNRAVGVLIIDEPEGLESTFRAVLEHHPILQTLSEADLSLTDPASSVAVVFVPSDRGESAVARIRHLKERRSALTVLVAFEMLAADTLCRLINAGADAFVARSAQPRDVCATILDLAGLAAPQAPPVAKTTDSGDSLTPREAEILRFLSAGFSNKEVARRLNLSVRTVETHRLNLRRKTQTGRLEDLVALARHLGLAPVFEAETRRASAEPTRCERLRLGETDARH
jgi:DNA-binding NarL/FixJ family response regulator